MTDNIIPLRFNVEEVGKHVKSSKKRFTWDVSLNSRQHSIVLDFSYISGKVKVAVDRKILLENQLPANTSFQYPFTLDGVALNVIQQGDNFELRMNNKVFSHLYNQMKTNKEFKKYQDQIKDIKVNQTQFQVKKMTLNIGGVGGGMKKKPKTQSYEEHNWNAFEQGEFNGFPSYFEGQSVSTTASFPQKIQHKMEKVSANLLDESSLISNNKKQQKVQNIIDFENEVQQQPLVNNMSINNPSSTKDEFNTMQLMFSTLNVGNNVQNKPNVVIDSNQVDFFASEEPRSISVSAQKPIDFFSGMNSPTLNPPVTQNQQFNTMQMMFATSSNQNNNFGVNSNLNTNTNLNQGLNLNAKPQTQNSNLQTLNWNSTKFQEPSINKSDFTTMQQLFATGSMNLMGINTNSSNITSNAPLMATNIVNSPSNFPQNSTVQQPSTIQTNSINLQHFSTQQLPTQNFGTSFNLGTQAFGTQNFSLNNPINQATNIPPKVDFFSELPKNNPQNVNLSNQTSAVQSTIQPSIDISNINMNDFSTMQQLFKTNSLNLNSTTSQVQSQSTTPVSQPNLFPQQFGLNSQANPSNKISQSSFATGNIANNAVQSPNMMYMNTYSGSNGAMGLGFDMNLGNSSSSSQQFNTSANISMMKKQSNPTGSTIQANSSNSNDLI